ncbi:MAG: hypothetical protein AB8F26_03310 [Phycisphaerales bacterium]
MNCETLTLLRRAYGGSLRSHSVRWGCAGSEMQGDRPAIARGESQVRAGR